MRVVVLTGAGRAFCAGDNVKEIFLNPEFRDAKPNKAKDVEEWRSHAPVALDFLIEYPKPTIASVNGAAVGYGCDIALMCDMRVLFRPGAVRRSFHSAWTDSRSGRPAGPAAAGRSGARLRADPHRRHHRCEGGRAHRDG